ncbi:CerR family C-terminal domain-containing protein [Emcibacter sp. SYSU 3D8]|uniref:CerR family C-terminal domain-containing protein n=1 Tax=Emcibacter sp. SYSU 3D8 TaxID=3133969 RepID=UPI0031FF39C9
MLAAGEKADAKQRLIEAALRVFGEHGFKGASTRAIAGAAGVNIAAIPYYFGGKEGLYMGVVGHIADQITARMSPGLRAAEQLASDSATTPEQRRQAMLALGDRFISMMVGTEEAALWARIMVREQFDPTEAFDVLYSRVMAPSYMAVSRLLGPLLGLPAESEELKLRIFSVIGQALIFRVARTAVLRRLEWDAYTPDRLDQIRAAVRANIIAIMDAGRPA